MSDALKKYQEGIEQDAIKAKELSKKKEALQEKRLFVDTYKYEQEYQKIVKNEEDIAKSKNANVGIMTDEEITSIVEENEGYFRGTKSSMMFMNECFKDHVSCWPGNIILCGGISGKGKSTAVANLVLSTIKQKNPTTGSNRKVLVISPEERPSQVYARLTCLYKGYNFNKQNEFNEDQVLELSKYIEIWAKKGVTVIGEDKHNRTTSVEGIRSIMENLVKTDTVYDMVILDYAQKVNISKKNPNMKQDLIMLEMISMFDYYKNFYPGVFVVMSQLWPNDHEGTKSFEERIKGCKTLITPCTVALEIVADKENLMTKWIVHKNRFLPSFEGGTIKTGFDRGHFIPYTDQFKKMVNSKNDAKERNGLEALIAEPKPETKE